MYLFFILVNLVDELFGSGDEGAVFQLEEDVLRAVVDSGDAPHGLAAGGFD